MVTIKNKKTSVSEHVEKLVFLCIVGVNLKWYSHCRKWYVGSSKELPFDPAISTLDKNPKELKAVLKKLFVYP